FSSLPLPLSHSLLLPYTTLFRSSPTWGNFLASISIAMVTYTGIETISNLSEEAKDPGRNVPLATWWVIVAVLFVSAFLPTIGVSVFPVEHVDSTYTTQLATTWKADPVRSEERRVGKGGRGGRARS